MVKNVKVRTVSIPKELDDRVESLVKKPKFGGNRSKAYVDLLEKGLGTDETSQRILALEEAVASLRSEKLGRDVLEKLREELRRIAGQANKGFEPRADLIYLEEQL